MTKEPKFDVGQKVKHIGNGPLRSMTFKVGHTKELEDDYRIWYVCTDDEDNVYMLPETVLGLSL